MAKQIMSMNVETSKSKYMNMKNIKTSKFKNITKVPSIIKIAKKETMTKYCQWCLEDAEYYNRSRRLVRYALTRKSRDEKIICNRCYNIMLNRERAVGIIHPTHKQRLLNTIKDLKFKSRYEYKMKNEK